ncbi:hypothetical protein L2E82_48695 [Cichorium intybus]|uniref:Uncharacterized protein n=1 Tax=Cichorium intybus TaxID=13427 RepID=A0ACB8Z039_CICIN|nr:hypothetical protein L2E82_48695 [Cichorium intybus]
MQLGSRSQLSRSPVEKNDADHGSRLRLRSKVNWLRKALERNLSEKFRGHLKAHHDLQATPAYRYRWERLDTEILNSPNRGDLTDLLGQLLSAWVSEPRPKAEPLKEPLSSD